MQIVTDWPAARAAIVEQRGERLAGDVEALLRERELLAAPGSWAAAFCLDRGWPLPEEMLAARRRIEDLEARIADAHCLLQDAFAAVDPEAFPELSARLFDALEPCELPQCRHVSELLAKLAAMRGVLVEMVEDGHGNSPDWGLGKHYAWCSACKAEKALEALERTK